MLRKSVIIVVLLLMIPGMTGGVHANELKNQLLSPAEKKDVQQAKVKTEKVREKMDKQDSAVYYGDKKEKKITINPMSVSDFWKRKGVFYVELETSSSGSLSWAGGHAGIAYNNYYTVESWGTGNTRGVQLWDNNWNTRYKHFKALTTYGTSAAEDASTADKAYSYIGKPYNYNFFYINQSGSFYCSQLVWYVYKHVLSIDLNDGGAVWPVDLTQTDKAYTIYAQ